MSPTVWIPAFLLFGATAFGTIAFVLMWEVIRDGWQRRAVRRQLADLVGTSGRGSRAGGSGSHLLREGPLGAQDEDDWGATIRSLPGIRQSLALLEQADVKWSPVTFYLLTLGAAVATGSGVMIVSGSLLLSGMVAACGAVLPYLYLRKRSARIGEAFERDFPDGLDLLTRAIRAGHPLTAGLRMVAEEGPDQVAKEFRTTFEELRFGLPFDDALLGMVDRVGLVDVRIFATAVLIQKESGGNLAEILDTLGSTIRDRFTIRRQLRVYTAQGRLSGYTLAALPIVVGFLLYLIEPPYVTLLFTETIGRALLGTGFVLQVIGYLWIRKIVNIEI